MPKKKPPPPVYDPICLSLSDSNYDHPILVAVREGDHKLARRIIRRISPDDLGWLLLLACEKKLENLASSLLKHGVDPTSRCQRRLTPLHYACQHEKPQKLVKLLMEYGADPNAHDAAGNISIHFAPRKLQQELVNLMTEYGCYESN